MSAPPSPLAHFQAYAATFARQVANARRWFAQRDWVAQREDYRQRLQLLQTPFQVARTLPPLPPQALQAQFDRSYASHHEAFLARGFANALAGTWHGYDATTSPTPPLTPSPPPPFDGLVSLTAPAPYHAAAAGLLDAVDFGAPYGDRAGEVAFLAEQFAAHGPAGAPLTVRFYPRLFYRNQHAYLAGEGQKGDHVFPFVVPFTHPPEGIRADAFLTDAPALRQVFGFSRSYLFVDAPHPTGLVAFLRRLMPHKSTAQLFINLGFPEAGRQRLLTRLRAHLARTDELFAAAPGVPGMVMIVFTLPGHNQVFKIIRDHIRPPKTTNRTEVLAKYAYVAAHDRVGRLADTQLFERLVLPRSRFHHDLLAELCADAPSSVTVRGDTLVLRQVFAERKMVPLDVFIRRQPEAAAGAVAAYGQTVRELAMSNLFPGDLLLKNFGVTTAGRVVFYDYDEVCPLTECRFRALPTARQGDEFMDADWFSTDAHDVFPEQFLPFMVPAGPLRRAFVEQHADLLTPAFWNRWKRYHAGGGMVDLQPYVSRR